MNEPLDPRDPSRSGPGPREVSAAAEHAREQLREEFEQLRVEIEELRAEESGGDDPLFGGGFRNKARASVAVLALTAAIAAAAGNFALNGGRTPKDGSVSVPPPSSEPEPGAITAGRGGPDLPFSRRSLIGHGLQTPILGSNARLPSASPPVTGPSSLFVIGDPVPVRGRGSRGGDVAGADPVRSSPTPVSQSPTPTPPVPEPDASQPLAYSPPPAPAPAGGTGDSPGNGEIPGDSPGHGGKPGNGASTAATPEDDAGGGGKGLGKGHIKAIGKGHGGSPGKGHEKDQGDGEVADTGSGEIPSPSDDPGGHGGSPGKGHEKEEGDGEVADTGSGSNGNPDTESLDTESSDTESSDTESSDTGHGKSAAHGQSGK